MPVWYSNPDPSFQYAMRVVTDITNATNAVVTTSVDHNYMTGLIVRLYVPRYYGMKQANRKKGTINVLSNDTFSIEIDTQNFDPFVIPAASQYYWKTALVVPIGNIIDPSSTVSFKNVS